MIFTLVLWCTGTVIYLSGRDSKVNRWCAVCFFLTSIGTFKEFLMDSVVPLLSEAFPAVPADFYMSANSVLTAVLYLGAPFCFITLAMHFNCLDEKNAGLFRGVRLFTAGIIVILLFFFWPFQFKEYQLTSPAFWHSMSLYNLGYALAGTIIIVNGIRQETKERVRRRKKLLVEILIPPYYWWLSTIFIVHTLGMQKYLKAWKANLYLSLAVFVYYFYIALREGMMGIQLRVVLNPWDSDIQAVDKSTHYMNHMIKNQAVKIDWCIDILREKNKEDQQRELDIMEKASWQLQEFARRTTRFLNTSVNDSENIQVSVLLKEVLEEWKLVWKEIELDLECRQDAALFCDVVNMKEVLWNLLDNAADAMDGRGKITVCAGFGRMRRFYCIRVCDTGRGMDQKTRKEVFSPFFTTKKKGIHYGLGLAFCKSIMRAHGGKIMVNSRPLEGTEVILRFPGRRVRRNI